MKARTLLQIYIPKDSRVLAVRKQSHLVNRVVADPNCIEAWRHLQLSAKTCFSVSARGGNKHRSSPRTKVNTSQSDYI